MFYYLDTHAAKYLEKKQPYAPEGTLKLCPEALAFEIGWSGKDQIGMILNFPVNDTTLRVKTFDVMSIRNGFVVTINPRNRGLHLAIIHRASHPLEGETFISQAFLRRPRDLGVIQLPSCSVMYSIAVDDYKLQSQGGIILGWRGAQLYNFEFDEKVSCSYLRSMNLVNLEGTTAVSDNVYKPNYHGSYIDVRNFLY